MNVKSINMNDKDFVLEQAKQDGYNSLFYANDRLQNDEEVVLAAVNQNGRSLEYASARLKDDYDGVLAAAVNQDGTALNYASDRLRSNVNFCIECAKKDPDSIAYFLGEAKDLFETYNNDIDSVEQQNKANEALLAKLSTKSF